MGSLTILSEIAGRVVALGLAHPIQAGIDCRSAAGKTTFADGLVSRLRDEGRPVVRASIDDFHTPGHAERSGRDSYTWQTYYDEAYDYQRFRLWVGRGVVAGMAGTAVMTAFQELIEMPMTGREKSYAPANFAAKILPIEPED
jgi:hypothetical protein